LTLCVLLNVLVVLGAEEKATSTKAIEPTKAEETGGKTIRQALFARNDYGLQGGSGSYGQQPGQSNLDYQGRNYGGAGGGYYDKYNTYGSGSTYGSNNYGSNTGYNNYGGSNTGYGSNSGYGSNAGYGSNGYGANKDYGGYGNTGAYNR